MFDFARFRRLVAATWLENRRAWAWFLGIGVIVHFVLLLVILAPGRGFELMATRFQGLIYFTGLFLTAPIFANRYFAAMSRRESALLLLMRPASAFEKWLLAVLVVAIAYPLAYTLAFQVCNLPGAQLAAAQAAEAIVGDHYVSPDLMKPGAFLPYLPWREIEGAGAWLALLLPLASVQAFGLLGSLYFRAMSFLKTVLAGFLVLLVLMLASAIGRNPALFLGYWMVEPAPDGWAGLWPPVAWFAIPALLWIGCLFALREREEA